MPRLRLTCKKLNYTPLTHLTVPREDRTIGRNIQLHKRMHTITDMPTSFTKFPSEHQSWYPLTHFPRFRANFDDKFRCVALCSAPQARLHPVLVWCRKFVEPLTQGSSTRETKPYFSFGNEWEMNENIICFHSQSSDRMMSVTKPWTRPEVIETRIPQTATF